MPRWTFRSWRAASRRSRIGRYGAHSAWGLIAALDVPKHNIEVAVVWVSSSVQVCCFGLKYDGRTIARDRRSVAEAVCTIGDVGGGLRDRVVQEDVLEAIQVGLPRHQVRGEALERHGVPVR